MLCADVDQRLALGVLGGAGLVHSGSCLEAMRDAGFVYTTRIIEMADDVYCLWVSQSPCLKPEIWAAWAQALLSALAIWAGARLANRQERRNLARKTDLYVNLISMAEIRSLSLAMYTPGDVRTLRSGKSVMDYQIRDMQQFAAAFRAINLEDLPDYRLLPPLRDAADTCEHLVEHLERVDETKSMSINDETLHIGKQIKHAQWRLNKCYLQAAEVANEYQLLSFTQLWNRIRLHALAKYSRPIK